MTYVLGAKCTDGVVLVSDTKFTTYSGTDDYYDDKITGEKPSVLTAFSGSREPFEEFRMRLREFVREHGNKTDRISLDKLIINIGHIMDYLDRHYSNYPFDLLVDKTANPSILYYFYQDGRLESVTNYKAIGSGATHGLIYLKKHFENKSMDKIAELGYFIVRYIERFGLDCGVGTGKSKPNPQIRFVPNDKDDYVLRKKRK